MKNLTSEVPVGLGSVLGLIGTIAATVTMVVQSITENQNLLEGANKPAGILAFIAAIATMLGRQYQAGQKGS